jgi:hypothetical protein
MSSTYTPYPVAPLAAFQLSVWLVEVSTGPGELLLPGPTSTGLAGAVAVCTWKYNAAE